MTPGRNWIVWIAGALLLAIVASVVVIENRGGHYPIYKAPSFFSLASPRATVACSGGPTVEIGTGTLRGAAAGSAIAFRGIPYAQPPLAKLRWQPPRPAAAWAGVRDASRPGNACTQRASGLTPFFAPMAKAYDAKFEQPPIPSSEDWL